MKIREKFKYAIFDVDGTIFDNMDISADAFAKILADYRLPQNDIKKIHLDTNGMNLNDQLKLVFDKYGIKYNEALIEKLNKSFFDLRDSSEKWKNAPVFPGVNSLIENLTRNGVKNFVSSGSNADEVIFRLKKAEIHGYFDMVLGGDKIPKGLGHFEKFAEYCGVSLKKFAKSAFMLSDGSNDMELAKKAGIFAIGVTNTLSAEKLKSGGADLVVSNINDLTAEENQKIK